MLALDHRSSFKQMVEKSGQKADAQTLIEYKTKILNAVYKQAGGVLLDPEIGLQALKRTAALYADENSSSLPYLLSMEKSGYKTADNVRKTELQYSAKELKEKGAKGVKLLLYIDPNQSAGKQNHQLQIADQALQQADEANLPLFLEIVTYNTEKKPQVAKALGYFLDSNLIPGVFKLEYPGSREECKKISKMTHPVPWILLTRGKKFAIFKQELEIAVSEGAQGFLAGRALWQELFNLQGGEEEKFLQKTLPKRFNEIAEVAINNQQ